MLDAVAISEGVSASARAPTAKTSLEVMQNATNEGASQALLEKEPEALSVDNHNATRDCCFAQWEEPYLSNIEVVQSMCRAQYARSEMEQTQEKMERAQFMKQFIREAASKDGLRNDNDSDRVHGFGLPGNLHNSEGLPKSERLGAPGRARPGMERKEGLRPAMHAWYRYKMSMDKEDVQEERVPFKYICEGRGDPRGDPAKALAAKALAKFEEISKEAAQEADGVSKALAKLEKILKQAAKEADGVSKCFKTKKPLPLCFIKGEPVEITSWKGYSPEDEKDFRRKTARVKDFKKGLVMVEYCCPDKVFDSEPLNIETKAHMEWVRQWEAEFVENSKGQAKEQAKRGHCFHGTVVDGLCDGLWLTVGESVTWTLSDGDKAGFVKGFRVNDYLSQTNKVWEVVVEFDNPPVRQGGVLPGELCGQPRHASKVKKNHRRSKGECCTTQGCPIDVPLVQGTVVATSPGATVVQGTVVTTVPSPGAK